MHATLSLLVPILLASVASAAPRRNGLLSRNHKLHTRHANLEASCSRQNPNKQGETYGAQVDKIFEDIAILAAEVQDGVSLNLPTGIAVKYTESDAFKHYFAESEKNQVMEMFKVVSFDKLTANFNTSSYSYNVKCGTDQDKYGACGSDSPSGIEISLYNDAADPGLIFCDAFFQGNRPNLDSKDNTKNGWCVDDAKFSTFEVSAFNLLEQFTKMDAVGKAADLKAKPITTATQDQTHGTINIVEQGTDADFQHYAGGDAVDAARKLKVLFEANSADASAYEPLFPPTDNSVGYAASAIEWHFQRLCGLESIAGDKQ